jgi:tetratricopeptide (TPR) repeat protein
MNLPPQPAAPRRLWQWAVAGALLLAAGLAAYWLGRRTPMPDNPAGSDDPRLTFATPFRNVRPEVKYVGDSVCASCHDEIAATYREHSMGRSLAPVAGGAARQRDETEARNPFEALGARFQVERRGDRFFHRETHLDPGGRETALVDAATYAEALGQAAVALAYWQRARNVNPWSSRYRFQVANLHAQRQEWDQAVEECRAVLRFNPANVETRLLLVAYHAQRGDKDRARAEFDTVLALNPPDPDRLRAWFAEKMR